MLLNCGVREDSWESLGPPVGQTSLTLYICWKDWCWSWSSNTLATWCEEPTHWKRPWCWETLKALLPSKRVQQRTRWLDSFTDSMDVNLSKLREIVKDRGAWHAFHGVAKSQTQLRDGTTPPHWTIKIRVWPCHSSSHRVSHFILSDEVY